MNLQEFFHMGGYAIYVWSSYGIALVALSINVLLPLRQRRQLIQRIATRKNLRDKRPQQ